MRFNIRKIEIENFRSIKSKVTLEIKPGLFAIEGINLDEIGATNGVGKSSLLSALYWCISGNTLTNEDLADDIVNSEANKDCRVTVYIDSSQGEVIITRTRKDTSLGNSLQFSIGGQDLTCHKIADTQQRIGQLFKIPYSLIASTILIQGDMKSAFSKLPAQMRIQVLESIRDYSIWDKVRDNANSDIKVYANKIKELELKNSEIVGSLTAYTRTLDLSKNELTSLQNTYNEKVILENIHNYSEEILSLDKQIEELEIQKRNLNNQSISLQEYISKLKTIEDVANKIVLDKQKLTFEKQSIEKEISVIDKWFVNDTCPTCKRKLERTQEEINNKTNEKMALQTKISEINIKINEQDNFLQEKRKEWSEINKEVTILNEKEELKVKELNTFDINIKGLLNKKAEFNNKILKLQHEKDSFTNNVLKIENKIKEYSGLIDKLNAEKDVNKKEIDKLYKKRQLSDYFYKLLGSKGELRPYLLRKDIEFLNHSMQKYISAFFKNTTAELKLNGSTIDIEIMSGNIKKKVSSLSSGEEKRLNLSIQLALYDLIASTSQIDFNILWLDEIETNLDPLGCQNLIEIIDEMSSRVESVFWITNVDMVKSNIPHKIICQKKFNVTEVFEQ